MKIAWFSLLLSAELVAIPSQSFADVDPPMRVLDRHLKQFIAEGAIVSAQIAVRREGASVFAEGYGVVAEDSDRPVDAQTLYLIASSSKPFASACLLSLMSDPATDLSLSDPVAQWLPAFATVKTEAGESAHRSPTVDELLSHHSGIYSQKAGMTAAQGRWIRSFETTLEEAVDGKETSKVEKVDEQKPKTISSTGKSVTRLKLTKKALDAGLKPGQGLLYWQKSGFLGFDK